MGADLYILDQQGNPPSGDDEADYNRRYFRDSYNATCLLWALGLSWWVDVNALLDESHLLLPGQARQLMEMVESRRLPSPEDLVKTEAFQWAIVDEGANSPQVWWNLTSKKKAAFVSFLLRAIEVNAPILCSV